MESVDLAGRRHRMQAFNWLYTVPNIYLLHLSMGCGSFYKWTFPGAARLVEAEAIVFRAIDVLHIETCLTRTRLWVSSSKSEADFGRPTTC